jgi:hypothetical protein
MRGLRGDTPVLATAYWAGSPALVVADAAGDHSRIAAPTPADVRRRDWGMRI